MQLTDYFDFLAPDDIRIKGTRVGIETVLYAFIHQCKTPEEIDQMYPSINLEQIYATILYYLHEKDKVNAYLEDWLEWSHQVREEQKRNPPKFVEKMRQLKQKMDAEKEPSGSQIFA